MSKGVQGSRSTWSSWVSKSCHGTLSHAGGPRGRKLDWTLVSGGGLVQPSVLGCSMGVFTEEGVHRTGMSPQVQHDEGSGETAHTQPLPPPMLSTVGPAGC